jgi:ATPase family associated with various cellular activities (AAA)
VHHLYLGATNMGKSTLARRNAADFKRRGIHVLALDPYKAKWQSWPPGTWCTSDIAALRRKAEVSQRCVIFIDEAGRLVGRGSTATEHQWFTTESRHEPHYHLTCLITQAGQQLDPTLRSQCSVGYIFRLSRNDARFAGDIFADDRIASMAPELVQREFLYVEIGKPPRKMIMSIDS